MTYEEAKEILKVFQTDDFMMLTSSDFDSAVELAIKAMKKQVAQSVLKTGEHLDQITGSCTSCGFKDSEQRGVETYCIECGQKLRWE